MLVRPYLNDPIDLPDDQEVYASQVYASQET